MAIIRIVLLLAAFLGASLCGLEQHALAKRLAGYYEHALILQRDGSVFALGSNTKGQLADGTTTNRLFPVTMLGITHATDVSSGFFHSCVVDAGQVKCTGSNEFGSLGVGTKDSCPHTEFATVTSLGSDVDRAYNVPYGSCVRLTNGEPRCWGNNHAGQTGVDPTALPQTSPVTPFYYDNVLDIASGTEHFCMLTNLHVAVCGGNNLFSQLGRATTYPNPTRLAPVSGSNAFVTIAAGHYHTCGVTTTGATVCWGRNQAGQLGRGTATYAEVTLQQPIGLGSATASIVANNYTTMVLLTNGTAWAFGENRNYILGNGQLSGNVLTPIVFSGLSSGQAKTGIVELQFGDHTTWVLDSSDAIVCLGQNNKGQMGQATVGNSYPTFVTMIGNSMTKQPTRAPTT